MEKAPTLEWWDFDKIGFKYSISRNVILNDEEAFKYCLTFTMWLWTTLCLGQLGYFKPWLSCINPFYRKPVFPLNFTISLLWPPPTTQHCLLADPAGSAVFPPSLLWCELHCVSTGNGVNLDPTWNRFLQADSQLLLGSPCSLQLPQNQIVSHLS